MTTDEFNKKLDRQIAEIEKFDKPLFIAVKSIMAIQSKRIFLASKNKSGANIGEYENREYYINPKNSPKTFATKGKNGDSTFKDGSKHKTGYFKDFLEYKRTIGRNQKVGSVDLILSGELQRNWSNGKIASPEAIKINNHNYQVTLSDFNVKKVERYGVNEVFGLSKSEKEIYLNVINNELLKAMR